MASRPLGRGRGQEADSASARCRGVVKGRDSKSSGVCGLGRVEEAGTGPSLPDSRCRPAGTRARARTALTSWVGSRSWGLLFLVTPPRASVAFPHCLFREFERDLCKAATVVTERTAGVWEAELHLSHKEPDEMPPSPRTHVIGQCWEEPTDSWRHAGRTVAPVPFPRSAGYRQVSKRGPSRTGPQKLPVRGHSSETLLVLTPGDFDSWSISGPPHLPPPSYLSII